MKSNNADNVMKEKLGSLDTLSGGIVYGKEEAWEKLQGRLDAKPAKRMSLKYSMAAALLLLLGIAGFYLRTTEKTNTPVQITKATTSQQSMKLQTAALQPETMVVHTSVNNNHTEKQKRNTPKVPHTSGVWDTSVAAEPKTPVAPVVVIQTSPAPVIPKPTRMKVVHINELDREDEQQNAQQNIAANVPALDVSKLPKVHINDVIHEEDEVEKILRENRLGANRQFFLWHNNNSSNDNSGNGNTSEYQPLYRQRFRIN